MANCMYCGSVVPDGAKFCTSCGAALPVEAPDVIDGSAESAYDQPMGQQPYNSQPGQAYQQPGQQQYSQPQYGQPNQQYQAPGQSQPVYGMPAQPPVVDTGHFGWGVLGFFFPIVGIILYFVWRTSKPKTAKVALYGGIIGIVFNFVYMWATGGLLTLFHS